VADQATAAKNGGSAGPPNSQSRAQLFRAWAVEGKSPADLGKHLKHWRVAGHGWSRQRLSAESGIGETTIVNVEARRQNVSPEVYRALVGALAVDPLTARNALAPLDEALRLAGLSATAPRGTDAAKACWLRQQLAAGAFTVEAASAAAGLEHEHLVEVLHGRTQLGAGLWRKIAALAAKRIIN
jgi:transcriptional regulator with XRE-family HTH domain